MIDFVRTPASRFHGLPDYPFAPHYFEIDGLRLHFVDEGPREAAPILLLHGEPSWSFLYRHMITGLVDLGLRLATELEPRFARIVIGNGLLASENGVETSRWLIRIWQGFTKWSPIIPVGGSFNSTRGARSIAMRDAHTMPLSPPIGT